jgi:hypothetical protein
VLYEPLSLAHLLVLDLGFGVWVRLSLVDGVLVDVRLVLGLCNDLLDIGWDLGGDWVFECLLLC